MFEREKFNLEFKEKISRSFLKTVSAFANYHDGKILFGVNDNGEVVGIQGSDTMYLQIEHMINDSIDPVPSYTLESKVLQDKEIIVLTVSKENNTPYYYHGKAYRRSNTSTLEVDRLELHRLILEGMNIQYESLQSSIQDLDFTILEKDLKSKVGIDAMTIDVLRTLLLYDKKGYFNIAGKLLADTNDCEHCGIDIVKFGKDINQILYRTTLHKTSILRLYYEAIEVFERYYTYEEIDGFVRIKIELLPKEAFRESLANALVHRAWDIDAHIKISMYEDSIVIDSPGGLPSSITKAEYLRGNVSLARNPIIAGVFFRLQIIEQFGTGIPRIIHAYKDNRFKPNFEISSNSIRITLPLIETKLSQITEDEEIVYTLLNNQGELSRRELELATGYNKSKLLRILNTLINKYVVVKLGSGPETTYTLC